MKYFIDDQYEPVPFHQLDEASKYLLRIQLRENKKVWIPQTIRNADDIYVERETDNHGDGTIIKYRLYNVTNDMLAQAIFEISKDNYIIKTYFEGSSRIIKGISPYIDWMERVVIQG